MICEIALKSVHFSLRHPPNWLRLYNRSILLDYNRFSSAIYSEALPRCEEHPSMPRRRIARLG